MKETEEITNQFALYLGYNPTLTRNIEIVDDEETTPPTVHFELEEYPNPETAEEYVAKRKAEHDDLFYAGFKSMLVDAKFKEKTAGLMNEAISEVGEISIL